MGNRVIRGIAAGVPGENHLPDRSSQPVHSDSEDSPSGGGVFPFQVIPCTWNTTLTGSFPDTKARLLMQTTSHSPVMLPSSIIASSQVNWLHVGWFLGLTFGLR